MRQLLSIVLIAVLICLTETGHAAILNVPADYPDLKTALAAANTNDVIILDSGTFTAPGFKNILASPPNNITIRSKYGASQTIISGSGEDTFLTTTDTNLTRRSIRLVGLTIRWFHTAVHMGLQGSVQIDSCTFVGNSTGVLDDGFGFTFDAWVDQCRFDNNGTGVDANGNSWLRVLRSIFYQNGYGLVWRCAPVGLVTDNIFWGNLDGITISLFCTPVQRNVIANNQIGVYYLDSDSGYLTDSFRENNVWGNVDYNYYNLPDHTGYYCNFSNDPQFCDTSLQSLMVASPSPLLPNNNPCHVPFEMIKGVACYCGDVDVSGNLDIADVTALIGYLYLDGPPPVPLEAGEIDHSPNIDIGDLTFLIGYLYISGPPPPCGG